MKHVSIGLLIAIVGLASAAMSQEKKSDVERTTSSLSFKETN